MCTERTLALAGRRVNPFLSARKGKPGDAHPQASLVSGFSGAEDWRAGAPVGPGRPLHWSSLQWPPVGAGVDAPPVERFDAAAARNVAARRSVTDPTAMVTLPFATLPAGTVVAMNQLDVLMLRPRGESR